MTSEPKFTPGPWFVVANHPTNAVVCIHAECEDELATLYGPHEGEKDKNGVWPLGETRMANAHLIAAAPDLYAALVDARSELNAYSLEASGEDYNNPKINAALAKALGETK